MISIEPAQMTDRAEIEALLAANGLPVDGLELAISTGVVARDGDQLVGCAAVEPWGTAGLLRSVCVAAASRGAHLGRGLVDAAEAAAAARGITELYLLTETAADWFPRLGYSPITRADVPTAVTASPEFTGACPDTAAVFRKQI
jgi:amino-acid N-acetyltransferase